MFRRGGGADGSEGPRGAVTFCYHGYEVTVKSEGRIALTRSEATEGTAAD